MEVNITYKKLKNADENTDVKITDPFMKTIQKGVNKMIKNYEEGLTKMSEDERRYYDEIRSVSSVDFADDLENIATLLYCKRINEKQYKMADVKKVVCAIKNLKSAVNEFYASPLIRELEERGYTLASLRDTFDEF